MNMLSYPDRIAQIVSSAPVPPPKLIRRPSALPNPDERKISPETAHRLVLNHLTNTSAYVS